MLVLNFNQLFLQMMDKCSNKFYKEISIWKK